MHEPDRADRAVWRRLPDDPRTLLGWIWALRERPIRSAREGLGCLFLIGMVVLFAYGHPLPAIGLLAACFLLPRLSRPPRSIEPLLTLPSPSKAFPCEIAVRRDEVATGVDRGAVTFLDGWLNFEGFHTTLSLSRVDVKRRQENRLSLEGCDLVFSPDEVMVREFSSALDRWYRIDSAAHGISVLPPLGVHPSALGYAWCSLLVGGLKIAFCLAMIRLANVLFHGSYWFYVFLGGPGEFLTAVRDLRRLRSLVRTDALTIENKARNALES